MANIITGNIDDFAPTVGSLTPNDRVVLTNGEGLAKLSFVAEADPSATDPCFSATLPAFTGYIARLSVMPVTGHTPVPGDFTLTLADEHESSWTFSVVAAGSSDVLGGTRLDDLYSGKLTVSINDMTTGSERVEIALFLTNQIIAPVDLAQPSIFRVGDSGTDYIEIDPANQKIDIQGAASPLTITDLQVPLWKPPLSGEYTTGMFNRVNTIGSAIAADTLYGIPLILPWQASYSGISIRVDTGQAGANARLGIYTDSGGAPATLIEEAGAFTPTAAAFYDVVFAANRTLGPGFYWLVLVTDDAAVVWERGNGATCMNVAVFQSGTAFDEVFTVTAPHVYAALPASFGSAVRTSNVTPVRPVLKVA